MTGENLEKKSVWKAQYPQRWFLLIVAFAVGIIAVLSGALAVYGASFRGRVLPETYIGDAPVGGLDRAGVTSFLSDMSDKLADEGLRFGYEIDGEQKELVVYPEVASDSALIEFTEIDIEKEVDYLLGKDQNFLSLGWSAILSKFGRANYELRTAKVDKKRLIARLEDKLAAYESQARNAGVKVKSINPLQYEITPPVSGMVFDYEGAIADAQELLMTLRPIEIVIQIKDEQPKIFESDIKSVESRLPNVFSHGSISLNYQDPHTGLQSEWQVSINQIADWLEVQKVKEDGLVFGLKHGSVINFLIKKVESAVNVEAQDAKFKMGENGKVEEFQGSRPGIKLDLEKTYTAINDALVERTRHDEGVATAVTLAVEKTEPSVKTGDVNDFGIKEILGVGISNYSGSPKNRIKNIANAVKKLNGILIKPGEIFSAIQYTQPFTLEGGYLPEKVIKGDEIKPEIGGGLCQIGTTLFRMAMNAGMEIVERRNHSLVVKYYNDPVNGNPGTDATYYDPKPDFRFRNDTNNYVLIQTEMDTTTGELRFYLWGTNDGRKGSYSKPVVKRWIPYGEPKEIETTKLKPGEKECQNAFKGADTVFTYTREFLDGRKEEIVYESHYRALPQICLVGVEEKTDETAIDSSLPLVGGGEEGVSVVD